MNLNTSPSPFPIGQIQEDRHHFITSSPSSLSCRNFFNPTQDHTDYYHHHKDNNYYSSTSYGIQNKDDHETSEFKFTLWKKEAHDDPMKLILPSKTKNYPDRVAIKMKTHKTKDHKIESISSSFGSDNSSSNNNNINGPVRVCSDCNTTKTPLWRSGPKGPKSLCNACGIRQRKARRAMAADNGTAIASNQPPIKKINVLVKEKQIIRKNRNTLPIKKRFKTVGLQSNLRNNKLVFEDFLINLSKSLTFHGVFPEDEKDAAILLMALSCGLVRG